MYSTIKHFREDLTRFPPSFFVCVPLVLDTLHTRVGLDSMQAPPPSSTSADNKPPGFSSERSTAQLHAGISVCRSIQSIQCSIVSIGLRTRVAFGTSAWLAAGRAGRFDDAVW